MSDLNAHAGRPLAPHSRGKLLGRLVTAWLVALVAISALGSAVPRVSAAEPIAGQPADQFNSPDTHVFADGVYRTPPGISYAPDRLLVKFRNGVSPRAQATDRESIDATVERAFGLVPGLEVLRIRDGRDVIAAAAELSRRPDVEYAMPDFAYQIAVEPDDPSYTNQWALPNIGAPAAWERSTGSNSVIVAVMDTGIDLDHPDLAANIVPGWNFVTDTADASDDQGHGTHVAGIIGAVGSNGLGVTGVNWSVGLMPLKICDQYGACYLSYEIAALEFAVNNGARIANASFGAMSEGWQPERDAIAAAGDSGLLFVAAAGNSRGNNDAAAFYPASYALDNIVSVGASTPADALADFSNYGQSSVDLLAPGDGILSTVPDGYDLKSGTSMAAPQVAGAAALVKSLHPDWTSEQLRDQLIGSATPISSLAGTVASCGRLNIDAATDPATVLEPTLCVKRKGTGLGNVTSTPAAIDCGVTCGAPFAPNTTVTLTATPAQGATFAGWNGPCSGTATCVVNLSNWTTVTATFLDQTSQAGWSSHLIAPPAGRDPLPPGSGSGQFESFYNVSLSANGKVRAKTLYTQPAGWCTFATSDTGGVFLERKTRSGWVADGVITAPTLGPEPSDRWMNCMYFGSLTELSGDGKTLVVSQGVAATWPGVYRCVAFVYRRGQTGWNLDGTLYPAGANAQGGGADLATCGLFGREGAISRTGDRIAIYAPQPEPAPGEYWRPRVDVFARNTAGWSLEKSILAPAAPGCGYNVHERLLAMSGDGATILVGDPTCNAGTGTNVGRVYAYKRVGSLWKKPQIVASPDAVSGRLFGRSVAISADGLTASLGFSYPGQPGFVRASWVFELSAKKWRKRTVLAPTVADPEMTFSCTALVRAGQMIVCTAYDTHGFNTAQGSIYIFNRAATGWSNGATPVRVFAANGSAFDRIGSGDYFWRPDPAVPENGKFIDAPITALSLAVGGYKDRIGYEFRP